MPRNTRRSATEKPSVTESLMPQEPGLPAHSGLSSGRSGSEEPSGSMRSKTGKAGKNNDYIEIRLPKVRFQDTPLSPVWVLLLLVFSFLLGMTTTKIQYLQQGEPGVKTQQTGGQAQQPTIDDVKQWAKDIRLSSGKFNECIDTQKYQARIDTDLSDAIAASAEATPTFYVNGTRVVGAVPYPQFKEAIEQALAGQDTGEKFSVALGGLPILGRENAPVKIVEFSDFQCPFCRQFFIDTFPQIKKDYIDTGKVALYYRHLPLASIHPMAQTFANAAECANEQGKFWEMHDKIFGEQG